MKIIKICAVNPIGSHVQVVAIAQSKNGDDFLVSLDLDNSKSIEIGAKVEDYKIFKIKSL